MNLVVSMAGFTFIDDSLIRHQDKECCRKGPRMKHVSYAGSKVEDLAKKIDDLVVNSSEDTPFVYHVGTNNVVTGRSDEVYSIYKVLIRKIRDIHKRSVVCGLIPKYNFDSFILSRMVSTYMWRTYVGGRA